MSKTDTFGAPLSNGDAAAVDALNRAETLLLGYFADPLAEIDAALGEAPDFVMGQCFRAGLFLVSSEAGAEPELRRALKALRGVASAANERERGHIRAIEAWAARDFHGASEAYGRVLFDCPRDIIALQFAHLTDFLLGQATMLRDRVARVLPEWSEGDAEYGYLLGMHAFGLEECGHFAQAEETGRRAVALQPKDAWGYHAVAHVYEMQNRLDDGIAWLSGGVDDWSPENMFAYHNFWHLALYHLERDEFDKVLALYDSSIRPAASAVAMEMVDAASLLWRLKLRGVEVGERWTELAEGYEGMAEDAYYPFNDAHAMMAFVATGRTEAQARVIAALQAAAGDRHASARIIRDVGLPVARAFRCFGEGDYGTAFELLLDVRKRAQAFGGSNAQRDVLNLTLLAAAVRGGDHAAATGLANERLVAKPHSPFAQALRRQVARQRSAA
jgi:tetratricopeptide (TPR) repeat protein